MWRRDETAWYSRQKRSDTNGFSFFFVANLSILHSCCLARNMAYKWVNRTIHRLSPPNVLSIESNENRHRFATCSPLSFHSLLRCYFTLNALVFIHCFALVYLAPLCSTTSVPHYLFRQFFIRLQFRGFAIHLLPLSFSPMKWAIFLV